MKRVLFNFSLSEMQHEKLKEISEHSGVPMSRMLRNLVEEYLSKFPTTLPTAEPKQ